MSRLRPKIPVSRAQNYLMVGTLTVIPMWITWLVFDFILNQLSRIGMPWVRTLSKAIEDDLPSIAHWLLEPWFQTLVAALITLIGLYVLGWVATRMVGRRALKTLENFIARLPLVQTVYGSTKKLIAALQQEPENVERVVMIDFPTPGMKAVGLVTRTLVDSDTGEKLVAVYVPTTPNPTSGYIEIVPVDKVVSTDWTLDEAMTFIVSGGAIAPERISYSKSATPLNTSRQEDAA